MLLHELECSDVASMVCVKGCSSDAQAINLPLESGIVEEIVQTGFQASTWPARVKLQSYRIDVSCTLSSAACLIRKMSTTVQRRP